MLVDAIEKARKTGLFDTIAVTSDASDILDLAYKHGASTVYRTPKYADDKATDDDVANFILPYFFDSTIICKLYPCVPLLKSEDIGFAFLQLCAGASGVYSVDPTGKDAGAFYWFRRDEWRKRGTINIIDGRFPWDTYVLPYERCQDINYPEDLEKARKKAGG